jgi:CheY-like chemotaxis protein
VLANDGEEALRLLKSLSSEISLAVLDVIMPKLGGHEVYQQIRTISPNTKVVFCSGYDPDTPQLQLVEENGVRLIQKPFNPQDLVNAVREVLDENAELEFQHS